MEYKLLSWETITISENKTRKIAREFNNALLDWSNVSAKWDVSINANNAEKANDYLVWAMTWLSQDQIDELSNDEYIKILSIINKESDNPWAKPAK